MTIIPVGVQLTKQVCATIRSYLHARVPSWAAVPIVTYAKYLGLMVGPESHLQSWHDAAGGWYNASLAIAQAGMTPNM
eukprot:8179245-Karenia_brevis.AAC.1